MKSSKELSSKPYTNLKQHPVRQAKFWKSRFKKPLIDRVEVANLEIVDYLKFDNKLNGIKEEPCFPVWKKPEKDAFLKDLQESLKEMPKSIFGKIESKLAAIVLVDSLGSTGYTSDLLDETGMPTQAIIVLDVNKLQTTANQWATWKELSAFKAEEGYELKLKLEDTKGDNRKNAMQYLILHEMAHVLAVGTNIHPAQGYDATSEENLDGYWFARETWKSNKGMISSKFDKIFPERNRLRFYSAAGFGIPARNMIDMYESLEETSFPTLYAATNFYDDFAESIVSYVHVVMMKKPFSVEVFERGKKVGMFNSCWDTPRCAAKRKLIENFLSSIN